MRTLLLSMLALGAIGCEAVAPVDLHYVGANADGGDASDGASTDAGPIIPSDGGAVGDAGFCGCDLSAGEGCCVPKGGGASFCTFSDQECASSGGMFLGCVGMDMSSDSYCCWSSGNPVGGSRLAYAATCDSRAVSCQSSSDCPGTACLTKVCGGVTVGACGLTPVCP